MRASACPGRRLPTPRSWSSRRRCSRPGRSTRSCCSAGCAPAAPTAPSSRRSSPRRRNGWSGSALSCSASAGRRSPPPAIPDADCTEPPPGQPRPPNYVSPLITMSAHFVPYCVPPEADEAYWDWVVLTPTWGSLADRVAQAATDNLVGYSKCQTIGGCTAGSVEGSPCSATDGNKGYCFLNDQDDMLCGRTARHLPPAVPCHQPHISSL